MPADICLSCYLSCLRTCFNYQLNAQFLHSITIYMLHFNPRHVSSSTMLIIRRSNCIITSSGIITLCKWLYSTPVESRLQSWYRHSVNGCTVRRMRADCSATGVLYNRLETVTIPDAVIIQFDLLKMSMVMLETCRGL